MMYFVGCFTSMCFKSTYKNIKLQRIPGNESVNITTKALRSELWPVQGKEKWQIQSKLLWWLNIEKGPLACTCFETVLYYVYTMLYTKPLKHTENIAKVGNH